jgi:hypothetical protein
VKPYVGEVVHEHFRGRCTAALIGEFWEDLNTARLHIFETGGMTVHRRVERGEPGQDKRWHQLSDCPNVEQEESVGRSPAAGDDGAGVRRMPGGRGRGGPQPGAGPAPA